ncbi:type II secretion system minor pseudopilin GspK [Xylophilus sp. ASV27]|uniref:type II secretion system minor pseudopilin GspK n=1 Tax=Xylophilus sp. ASV27 TaxID=2795129 RepID=UPI00351C03D6
MIRPRQRGAALLAAMLTVTLVATFAAAAMWQQWRSVEVESAERARVQAAWVLIGALDWSRLILREDGLNGGPDYLAEPWALPLQEARLSSFLAAAERDTLSDATADVRDAFLSGRILDAQAKMNVRNLTQSGAMQEFWMQAFGRLFGRLGLPASDLERMAQGMKAALAGGENAPLLPERLEQLEWFGVSPKTLQALAPYATVLPATTPVNLNTADPTVLTAVVPGLDTATAQRVAASRGSSYFRSVALAGQAFGGAAQVDDRYHAIASVFFEVRGRLRLDQAVVEERSLVQRSGSMVSTVWRERGAIGVAQALQAASR